MPKEYSPFTPGLPVPIEFFVGRQREVEQLRDKVVRSTHGQFQVAFLSGERGIGKSSLASFVKFLVERNSKALGLHTFLGGVTSLDEAVRRIFDRLLKESAEKPWHEKILDFFGNHIKQVGLFGVSLEFGASREDLKRLANDFVPALKNLMHRLKDDKNGIFIILDDINGLASSRTFANWLKSLVDEIATDRDSLPLCLLLVGHEERRQSLISIQPSLARVFDIIDIQAWSPEETKIFFKNAFSKIQVSIDDDALSHMEYFTGGLPVLAHEIGDATFNIDSDNRIDVDDALSGILWAAGIVGRKLLEPQVLRAIQSPLYTKILRKAVTAEQFQFRFLRREIIKLLDKDEEKVLDNFLRKMKDLNVIIGEGGGSYRFVNRLHHLYFRMEARRSEFRGDK